MIKDNASGDLLEWLKRNPVITIPFTFLAGSALGATLFGPTMRIATICGASTAATFATNFVLGDMVWLAGDMSRGILNRERVRQMLPNMGFAIISALLATAKL